MNTNETPSKGQAKYPCPSCDRRFRVLSGLKKHRAETHDKKGE